MDTEDSTAVPLQHAASVWSTRPGFTPDPSPAMPGTAFDLAPPSREALFQAIAEALGFLAVRAVPAGRAFLDWWATQLHAACRDAPDEGLFTDQKYADLVPCLFPGVAVLRDPGCNVASWNLSTRRVRIGRDGGITVNGAPLRFWHFTKAGGVGSVMPQRHAGDSIAPLEIQAWYLRELARHSALAPVSEGWWHYGHFGDGTPVTPAVRQLYSTRWDLKAAFEDPFQAGDGSFLAWLRAHEPELLIATPPATAAS